MVGKKAENDDSGRGPHILPVNRGLSLKQREQIEGYLASTRRERLSGADEEGSGPQRKTGEGGDSEKEGEDDLVAPI